MASHPEDVRSKKGKLQGDYRKLFISGNQFIRKRVQKYIERGYSVGLDEFTADEIKDSMSFNRKTCPNPIENSLTYAAWEEPEFLKGWAIRVLKKSLFNVPYLNTIADILYVFNRSRKLYPGNTKIWSSDTLVQRLYPDSVIEADDGYDTDTFIENEARLLAVADATYRDIPGFPELAPALTPELKFHRMANIVIRDAIWPFDNPQQNFSRLYYGTVNPESGAVTNTLHNLGHASTFYFKALQDKGLRVATEDYLFASENDVVYDLHKHPMEGAINQENLEGYLQSHLGDPNKNAIPCYWHPEGGDSPRNCTQPLTLKDIFYCVDYNFFFKFKRGEQREDPSLSLNIPKYDQILYNTKEGEPQDPSWPNLFHQGVCPFCLESVSREAGCLYMTHPNPQGLPQSLSPFCNPALVYKEMLDYYRKEGRRADPNHIPDIQDHIEFCIECGRPSYNHKHFTYDEPRQLIRGNANICKGDGRVELYARVLEIRDSYSHRISRQETASRADDVVKNREKMEHAREAYTAAISKAEGADRDWGNGITFNEASDTKEHEGGRRRYTKTRKVKRSTK